MKTETVHPRGTLDGVMRHPHASHFCSSQQIQPRTVLRDVCAAPAAVPTLFAAWALRARHGLWTPAGTTGDPYLPQTAQPGKPRNVGAEGKDQPLRPTNDRIVFPWESPMTDIEWAVDHLLRKDHPELYSRIVELAIEHGGFKPPEGP